MSDAHFDHLRQTLDSQGPDAAIDQLCADLRGRHDFDSLFYALLMKARQRLGVSPIPTGPSTELPPAVHADYEKAIRDAAREVGNLYLAADEIPQAWFYFRMIGEPQPVREALDRAKPGEDDDIQPLVHIAFYEHVHPTRGFDWILDRFGLCNAITTLGSHDLSQAPDVRRYCIERLVRALYDELRERLRGDIEQREGKAPPEESSIRELLKGRESLFDEDTYHVDTSHLSSVVQMSIYLEPGPELEMARELCEYGQRLATRFQYTSDPPFENRYRDYEVYLSILADDDREAGLAHFRHKADTADPYEVGTYPAEVLVNLLLRLDRPAEALAVARQHLARADNRQLSCPSIVELCQKVKDYEALAAIAHDQGDPVHYLAGLLARRGGGK